MFLRVSSLLVALALVVLMLPGCSKTPVAEFDRSKTMLDDARLAEAEQYAPELLTLASDSLNAASVEMTKQDEGFAPFRDYDHANTLIASAEMLAAQARDSATARKEVMRLQDSTMIAELQTLITDTQTMLASAPKGKGSRIDIKVMQADIDAAANSLTAASDKAAQGKYLDAKNQLDVIKTQVLKIQESITAATSKTLNR